MLLSFALNFFSFGFLLFFLLAFFLLIVVRRIFVSAGCTISFSCYGVWCLILIILVWKLIIFFLFFLFLLQLLIVIKRQLDDLLLAFDLLSVNFFFIFVFILIHWLLRSRFLDFRCSVFAPVGATPSLLLYWIRWHLEGVADLTNDDSIFFVECMGAHLLFKMAEDVIGAPQLVLHAVLSLIAGLVPHLGDLSVFLLNLLL